MRRGHARSGWLGAVLLAFAAAFAAPSCGGGDGGRRGEGLHVGLVFDVGGIGDKSFNDSAYRGLLWARDSLGVSVEYLEPAEGTDREAALRQLAAGEADLVIGVGALFTDDVNAVAADFPEKSFACVDYSWREGAAVPANVVGLKFREEEGCFLVGAIAGLVTKTNMIGFVGGMENALIHKFEAGYRAGARESNPGIQILAAYAGVTPSAYKDPAKGKELALAQYDSGADIIFHASGSTGLGVFEAARERDRLAIGVDSDQQGEAPGHVLTSMIKRVDRGVFEVIRDRKEGRFQGGIREMGLAEGGLDYVYDEKNRSWITEAIRSRAEEMRGAIIAGRIAVPTR